MKNCTPLWREAHLQVKMYKARGCRSTFGSFKVEKVHAVVARSTFASQNVQDTPGAEPLLEVEISKKCTPLWREAHFEVKMLKTPGVRTTFGGSDVVSRGRRKGLCTSSKVSKTWGFCAISKNDGRHGTFEEDLQRCIFRGRRSTRDMFIRDVRRSGRWFPERGRILEHQICRFAKMILRDRCSTSYDLASIFRGRRSTLGGLEKSQNALVRGCQLCTQLSIFEGSLAEFFRFWCLQLRKMRKSRRITSLRMLSKFKHYTTLHYTTLHYLPLHFTTLHYTTLQLHNYTPLHSTTLHYTKVHYTTLHYTTLHYTTIHYFPLHFTTLHYTPLHYNYRTTLHYIPLHSTTLHYITLHSTTLHYTTLPSTTLHYITLHYTPLHYNFTYDYTTTLHYTKLHYTTLHYTTLHSTTFQYTILHCTTLHYTKWRCTTDRQVDR